MFVCVHILTLSALTGAVRDGRFVEVAAALVDAAAVVFLVVVDMRLMLYSAQHTRSKRGSGLR